MSSDRLTIICAKTQGDFLVDVALDLPLEGTTAIFGQSGAGKTSILRLISGLDKPDVGRIALGDVVWCDTERRMFEPAHCRSVGFMFQDARLFPHLDVAGNLAFAETRADLSKVAYSRADVIETLDLGDVLDRRVHGLSGGERQRVALGRTLMTAPDLLLFDEPLAALDASRKSEILPFLKRVTREFNVPTLYVTHDLREIAQIADRVVVLERGRVKSVGSVGEAFGELDSETCLLEGEIEAHEPDRGLTRAKVGGQCLVLPYRPDLEENATCRILIDPRDVAIALDQPRDISIQNCLPVAVTALEADDTRADVNLSLTFEDFTIRSVVTRAAAMDLKLEVGQRVFALIKSVRLTD